MNDSANRWRDLQDLYQAALERSPSTRADFLREACPDESLRREVESMLGAQRAGDELLERPAARYAIPPIEAGSMVGGYRVEARIGAGGMGEVYRATDTRLHRAVALKVLPAVYAQDPEWLARFRREARVLASLNHPNIAAIYGLEESDGVLALAMELVEGPTLRGAMPLEQALALAKQIAEALEYAHERRVVHRDLKPANIKVTPEGAVKVLDFGLAKAVMPTVPGEESPTLTATRAGAIMGTPAYMAPEQATGMAVDKRADVWAFGVVLYEMLTGRQLFAGTTVSETLANVLKGEVDLRALPAKVRPVVERCLRRDAKLRWRSIGDVFLALEERDAPATPVRQRATPWVVAAVLAAALAFVLWRATRPTPLQPLVRLSVDLGPDAMTGPSITAVISPDGRRLVFPARGPNGKQQLATRQLDQAQTTLLPSTENGHNPFFSADSQWVGFFAGRGVRKISLQGGAPVTLCDTEHGVGASWGGDGTIVAALGNLSGLSQVLAAGGTPQPLAGLGKGEATRRWPQILPGGRAVLFTASPEGAGMEDASVEAMSLKNGVTKKLASEGYFGRYLPATGGRGYLVYLHQGVLLGVAFDPGRLEVQGTPVPLLEDVAANPIQGGGQFDFSAAPSGHGTLVYLAGRGEDRTRPVMWLDSSGKMQPLIATAGEYRNPRFSPDGRRLALDNNDDIYIYDLARETMTRLTSGRHSRSPVWTPDGKHITFGTIAGGFGIWWVRSDASGEPRQILAAPNRIAPYSFSPDGRRLAYYENNPETSRDIWTLPLDTSDPDHPKPRKPEPFLITPSAEFAPVFSPDGRWIAYRSNESGQNQIYVRPFPAWRGGKWQISTYGGQFAVWSTNGRELFFETLDNRIWVVDYAVTGDSFVPGKPRLWSEKRIYYTFGSNLDLAPDGKRFAVFPMPEAAEPEKETVHVTFLMNFLDELKRRIPAGK